MIKPKFKDLFLKSFIFITYRSLLKGQIPPFISLHSLSLGDSFVTAWAEEKELQLERKRTKIVQRHDQERLIRQ